MNKNRSIRYYFFIKKLKKVSFCLFLLLILYSIVKYSSVIFNYTKGYYKSKIININKNICDRVIINGIKYSDYNYIQSKINNYCSTKDIPLDTLKEELLQDYWIKDLYIQKKYPNTLKINIIEYNPFAIYTEDNINYNLIDEYGNNIKIPKQNIANFNYLFIISGENVKDKITSPTFTILNEYKSNLGHFYHFDMYRVENEFEAENIGLSEIIDDKNSIKFIEWAENVPRYLPPHYKKITITKLGRKSRNIILEEI